MRKEVHVGKVISLVQENTFDLVLHPGAVAMIPINAAGQLVLVKQWRRAAMRTLLELPAGTLEPNESPDQCAQRELQEEIGFKAQKITPLGGFFTAPGFCDEYIHLYLAEKLVSSPLLGDDTDEIEVATISLEEALQSIEEGKIVDAKTIVGVYRYSRIIHS